MAQTSSIIGVSLTSVDTTAQFALGTRAFGSGVLGGTGEWEYVKATGTITTGKFVVIKTAGTAVVATTGRVSRATAGARLGVTQFKFAQGNYGFVALNGGPFYMKVSGKTGPTKHLGFAKTTPGALVTAGLVAVGGTAGGIYITTSGTSALLARGLLTFPRGIGVGNTPNG